MEEIDWGREATTFISAVVFFGIAAWVMHVIYKRSRPKSKTNKQVAIHNISRKWKWFFLALFSFCFLYTSLGVTRDIASLTGLFEGEKFIDGLQLYSMGIPVAGFIWCILYSMSKIQMTENEK